MAEEMILGKTRSELMEMLDRMMYPRVEYQRQHKVYKKQRATNVTLCKKCGGKCCKKCGCQFSPEDFEDLSLEGLKKEIDKGYATISVFLREDWYGTTDVYYLRVRCEGEDATGGLNLIPHHGACVMLTKKGCKLPFEKRPTGGRNLLPIPDRDGQPNCLQTYDIHDCAKEWLPYKKLLQQLVEVYNACDKEDEP